MHTPNALFDRQLLKKRRNRIAADFPEVDFLKHELCAHLADRLDDITRSFPLALDLGCHHGQLAQHLSPGKITRLIHADMSPMMASHAPRPSLAMQEENLPFADQSMDAVVSAGSLHWVNHLPAALKEIRRILKPDGLFLAILPGPATLSELRESFAAVEAQAGGIAPHIAPFAEVRDAGNLLSQCGFALPVVDNALLTLTYTSPTALMKELKAMGENNHLAAQRRGIFGKAFFSTLNDYYHQYFPAVEDATRIRATIELVTITAWSPHASQQQPAKRGSGQIHLGDALN